MRKCQISKSRGILSPPSDAHGNHVGAIHACALCCVTYLMLVFHQSNTFLLPSHIYVRVFSCVCVFLVTVLVCMLKSTALRVGVKMLHQGDLYSKVTRGQHFDADATMAAPEAYSKHLLHRISCERSIKRYREIISSRLYVLLKGTCLLPGRALSNTREYTK